MPILAAMERRTLIHYLCRDRWLAASVGGLHGVGSYIGDDESSHI